ncbi:MAG: phosphoribosylanthranilate isomerase [Candidatus Solibacter sp.]
MMIKVCGITNQRDASAAIDAGATAIGFNFYRQSPRYVRPDAAGAIAAVGVLRVGVFVNETPSAIEEIARLASLDVAQLHGDEEPSDFPQGLAVWKAARVSAGFDLSRYTATPAQAILLDGPAAELYGGAGVTFDWTLARNSRLRIIVAGGLDASNVGRAIALAEPWGIDSCSRIEASPGIKDHMKMTEFINAARQAAQAALRS